MAIKLHPSITVHPGVWLRTEVVEANGLSITEAAGKLDVIQEALDDLLGGRMALSIEIAVRFEQAFGLSSDTLMRMQARYDLASTCEYVA